MNSFKAILLTEVSYQDFEGDAKTVPPGSTIDVVALKLPTLSSSLEGRLDLEPAEGFIGSYQNDSFDLTSSEFLAYN